MLIQILNGSGYPASTETNPSALVTSDHDAKTYIDYLNVDCGCSGEPFTLVTITNLTDIK